MLIYDFLEEREGQAAGIMSSLDFLDLMEMLSDTDDSEDFFG